MAKGLEYKYLLSKDDEDHAAPLLDFIKAKKIRFSKWLQPPGAKIATLQAHDEGRRLFRGIASSFYCLHNYCQKTISGNFTLQNIWITEHWDVKFHNIDLRTSYSSRVDRTYRNLSALIATQVFDQEIPEEIEQWLSLMNDTSPSDMEYCIRCHPAIMADWNRMESFERMFKHLNQLRKKRNSVYLYLLKGLPYENWEPMVHLNDYLVQVYDGGNTKYAEKIPGLLYFIRNCDNHLLEKAIISDDVDPLFSLWHIVPMIYGVFPLFFGALAARLHENNDLRYLRLEDLMA